MTRTVRAADAARHLTLPDGPGKETVQAQCTKCHALGLIANSGGFTKQGWDELIGTMVSLPAAQKSEISDYLAKNFPEQPRPKPVVLPGDVKVNIREWNAPSLGSRPHDPEPGPGRIDLVDGHVRQRDRPRRIRRPARSRSIR